MDGCRITVEELNIAGSFANMTVSALFDGMSDRPRISACFIRGDDSRIIPMDLVSFENGRAVAKGSFDIPYLFYNSKKKGSITVNFLCSSGNGDSAVVAPETKTVIPYMKRNGLSHFLKCSKREKMKIISGRIFSLLFLPYRRLKVKPNKITFLSNRADRLTGNIKAVFHEVTKLEDVDITVMCKKGGIRKNLPNMFKFFKLYATSKVVFVDDYYHMISYVKKKDDVKLIQLWHACGAFKTFGFSRLGKDSHLNQGSPNHRQYDYVIVSSSDVVPYYAEGFGVDLKKVIPLGSPRCDTLLDKKYEDRFKKQFYKDVPQLAGKKVILFAPTFRGGGLGSCRYPIEQFETDKILSALGEDYCIAVKMHPYLRERPICSEKYRSRIFDFTFDYDINDLLFITDILITDYSSVIFEASIVNIPMLFFAFDLNEYSKDRDFYCNFEEFVPGKIVTSTSEIVTAIEKQDFRQELIAPFREKYFGLTSGHATDNVVEFTKKLLNQDGK